MDEQTNQQPTNQNNMQQPKNDKAMKITLLVIVAIILAVGAIAAGFFIGQHNKNQEVEQARQAAQQQARTDQRSDSDQNTRPAHELAPPKTTTETTCNADELSLTLGEGSGAAGTSYYPLVFTNTGDRTCTLFGYPGVSLVDNNGNQVGQPADRASGDEETMTLEPGQTVQSQMGVPNEGNFPAGECTDGATKVRVYPPNDTGYLSVASGSNITSWCPGFNVSPVEAAS